MKLTNIQVQNIGAIADATIPINKPVNAFYGQPCAGKSTLLHAIIWCGGGEFPADIIRHGADEAFIELTFDNALLRREFYRGKDGTKARPLTFIRDGKPVVKPFEEIQKLLNPFQLDQNYFINMKEKAKPAYLLELMGVDTSETDSLIAIGLEKASDIRKELAKIGEPQPVAEVKAPDLATLQAEKAAALQAWRDGVNASQIRKSEIERVTALRDSKKVVLATVENTITEANAGILDFDPQYAEPVKDKYFSEAKKKIAEVNQRIDAEIAKLEAQRERELGTVDIECMRLCRAVDNDFAVKLKAAQDSLAKAVEQRKLLIAEIEALTIPEALPEPVLDTAAIDARLAKANADTVAYARYLDYIKVRDQRQSVKAKLQAKTTELDALRQAKRDLLKGFADKSPIQGMTFSDNGDPLFEGVALDMLATSQQMRLSAALAALYPVGIGVELVDHGESLGKRIVDLVKYAEDSKRTVLTAVVGDKPAETVEGIGVWVVENGGVK